MVIFPLNTLIFESIQSREQFETESSDFDCIYLWVNIKLYPYIYPFLSHASSLFSWYSWPSGFICKCLYTRTKIFLEFFHKCIDKARMSIWCKNSVSELWYQEWVCWSPWNGLPLHAYHLWFYCTIMNSVKADSI